MRVLVGHLSVELPDTWKDQTVHTFVAPRVVDPRTSPHLRMGSGFRENVAFSREKIRPGLSPHHHIHQHLNELKTRLAGFRLLHEEPLQLGSYHAYSVSYQFALRAQKIDVSQMRVAILVNPSELVLFTGTSASTVFETKRQVFLHMLQSLQLHG